jgi:acetylornithine deacetylase/succinyl-diaminopimelate desuccinylase-like protein
MHSSSGSQMVRISRRFSGVVLGFLLVLLGSSWAVAQDIDYIDLREQLEVERVSMTTPLLDYLRAPQEMAFPRENTGKAFRGFFNQGLDVLDAANEYPQIEAAFRNFDGRLDAGNAELRNVLGVFLGDYMQVRYSNDIIRELRTQVQFRTYPSLSESNSESTEHRKSFDHLLELANSLGLEVINHDYETLEITVPPTGSEVSQEPMVIWGHIDVMRPVEYKWSQDTPPFVLTQTEGRFVGLGVYADKGPVVINLFALRALMDSRLQLQRPVKLLVSSTANITEARVAHSLKRLKVKPAIVLAADGVFPYAVGELGDGLARVSSMRGMKKRDGIGPETFYIYRMSAGASTNSIPAEARIWVMYTNPENSLNASGDMLQKWRDLIEPFNKTAPETRYGTYVQEDTLHLFAYGVPGHAETVGRNAIYDAAAATATVQWFPNSASDVLRFVGETFERDPTGLTTDMGFENDEMGSTWYHPVQFDRIGDEVSVLIDVRWPVGVDYNWVNTKLQGAVDRFNEKHDASIYLEWEAGTREPVQHKPTAAVAELLVDAFELASGDFEPPAVAVGRASSQLLPEAIPFGPEWPGKEKHGHTRHESISLREISDLSVAYVAALAWFGLDAASTTP